MSLVEDFLLEESVCDPSELEEMRRMWLRRALNEIEILNALAVEMQRQVNELREGK